MTRKDFELIARTMKANRYPPGYDVDDQWKVLAVKFADALKGTNANFDRAKFLKACGYAE